MIQFEFEKTVDPSFFDTNASHTLHYYCPSVLSKSSGDDHDHDAWRFDRPHISEFVLKRMRLASASAADSRYHHSNAKDQSKVHVEAIILERLTPSPRVLDIYGHCGTSVILEAMTIITDNHNLQSNSFIPTTEEEQGVMMIKKKQEEELDRSMHKQGVVVHLMNNFTTAEKFQIGLQMAESVSDIHGFKGGQIVHCDISIEKYALARDGSVKLNGFNNAEISTWDEEEEKYCTFSSGWYGGRVSRENRVVNRRPHAPAIDALLYWANEVIYISASFYPSNVSV